MSYGIKQALQEMVKKELADVEETETLEENTKKHLSQITSSNNEAVTAVNDVIWHMRKLGSPTEVDQKTVNEVVKKAKGLESYLKLAVRDLQRVQKQQFTIPSGRKMRESSEQEELDDLSEAAARDGIVNIEITDTGNIVLKINKKTVSAGHMDMVGKNPIKEAKRRAKIVSDAIKRALR